MLEASAARDAGLAVSVLGKGRWTVNSDLILAALVIEGCSRGEGLEYVGNKKIVFARF